MKNIKLIKLKLHNFKGIKDFELNANEENVNVYGDNATGKTTLFDAFVWLLFDKDSLNNATGKFDLKTLNEDGEVQHKLDHEVEAILSIDDKELQLKKVYAEKWTKKRGSNVENFSGHTTDYFVDEVPVKKKEFTEKIEEIVSEDVFKLLTNPSYFNENMHWKERRELLLEVAGDITNKEVAKGDEQLQKLIENMKDRSLDDYKKVINSKRRDINKQIEQIPTRIDEITRNISDLDDLNELDINSRLDMVNTQIDDKNEQIQSIKNGVEVNEIKKSISEIDLEIAKVSNSHIQNEKQDLYKLQAKLQEEQSNLSILQGNVKTKLQEKQMNDDRIKDYEKQLQDLREDYKSNTEQYESQQALEFNHDDSCICPTCEQDLPQDKVNDAIDKFNENKSNQLEIIKNRLDELNEKGPKIASNKKEIEEQNIQVQEEIDKITEQGKKKHNEIEKIETEIKASETTVTPLEKNENYIELINKKEALNKRIKEINQSVEEAINTIKQEITALKSQQSELQTDLSKIAQSKKSQQRIKELEDEERSLAKEYEKLEAELYLIEEFTKKKVKLLTENINKKFKYARFKLFVENINGGLEETCETTFEGVPFSTGLNNAARVNVGLDIIDTLSKHYEVQAPIFVDNAESVTDLIDVESQLISLIVSSKDKALRIETKSETESEVA